MAKKTKPFKRSHVDEFGGFCKNLRFCGRAVHRAFSCVQKVGQVEA